MILQFRRALHRQRPRSLVLATVYLIVATFLVMARTAGDAGAQERPDRVLSIGGAVTEIVYALGEDDRLVARDSTSTFPEAANALPDIGYMRALSPEGVLSVEPDLILARESSGPPEAIEVLKSADVEWVDVPGDYTAQGIDEAIAIVAEALGVPEKGEELRARLAAEFKAVAARIADLEQPKEILFVLSTTNGRIMASGTGTAADGIIELAGAKNVIDDFEGYKQLSDEAIISANPDAILMMTRGGDTGHGASDEELIDQSALKATTAGREHAVIRMDGLYLLGFGPRTAAAASDLAQQLYGNAFD